MALALIYFVAAFFAIMGLVALAQPERVLAFFGTHRLTRDGRSEVRAVYGGFGLAVAAVLLATITYPTIRAGVLIAVAVALLGMAGGRLVSLGLDGPPGRYPWLFLGIELILAAMLFAAL